MSNADTYAYLIRLLGSLLCGAEPPRPPEGCSASELMHLAQRHSVAGMAYYAAEKLPISEPVASPWRQIRDKALVKDITQQMELESLCAALSGAGIRFLPLKGCVIKGLYPQSDMRTMSDIDILIDERNTAAARGVMEGLGYSCEHFGYDIHDIYYKPPVMNVEIHRSLFGEDGREFGAVFSDPWSMCTHDGMHYSFRPDEFFAYILAHAVKHLEEGGTGIRTIMDLWVCLHSDMKISAERSFELLEPSGRADIARTMADLAEVWFGEKAHSGETLRLEKYIFGSGTYGTVENSALNRIERSGKMGYFMRLIFPTFTHMKEHYPVLNRAPVLLPACWFARLVTKPFVNRRSNMEKLRVLMKK